MSGRPLAVVGGAVLHGGRCLVARRSPAMPLPGKWEFPGGKVGPGEDPRDALRRELREELGIEVEVGPYLGRGETHQGDRLVQLDVYLARLHGGEVTPREHDRIDWLSPGELEGLDWAAADLPLVPLVRQRLQTE